MVRNCDVAKFLDGDELNIILSVVFGLFSPISTYLWQLWSSSSNLIKNEVLLLGKPENEIACTKALNLHIWMVSLMSLWSKV